MKKFIMVVSLLFIWGCKTVDVVRTPTFLDWENGTKVNYTSVSVSQVNWFAPTSVLTFVLKCKPGYERGGV